MSDNLSAEPTVDSAPADQQPATGETICAEKATHRKKSSFAGDFLKLVTGTGSAQIVGVLAAPVIARIFAPEAFGMVALFGGVSGVLMVIGCLRYEQPICLPKDDREAANAFALCLVLLLLSSCVTCVLVLLIGRWAVRVANAQELSMFVWLLPLNLLISGSTHALTFWNMRTRHFTRITVVQVVNRVVLTASQIGLGLAGFVSGSVLIGTSMFGAFIGLALLAATTLRDDSRLFFESISSPSMRFVMRRYSSFPKFGMPATLLNAVSWQLPSVLLSAVFSPAVLGSYSFSTRLIRVPANLLGTSFRSAIFPRLAEAKHAGTLAESVERALRYLVLISFFPCFLLSLCGKDLFLFVFGARWGEAGVYTQLLSIWLFFWFISVPLNTVYAVLEQQALDLHFQAANLITRLAALAIGGAYGSARLAIALFSIFGVFVYGAYCYAALRKSGSSLSGVLPLLGWNALACMPAGALILLLHARHSSHLTVLIASALMLVIYCSVVLRTDPTARVMFGRVRHRFPVAR